MLQLPLASTTDEPKKEMPSDLYRSMVSPAVPVPLMAGLAFLVMLSPKVPLSFRAPAANLALKLLDARALVLKMTFTGTAALVLPAASVAVTLKVLTPMLR